MRIVDHPILGPLGKKKKIKFIFNGKNYTAFKGDTIASALIANDIRIFRYSTIRKEPRSIFCGIGKCDDCNVVVNEVSNVKACITKLEEGIVIKSE